jgi:hypothetical protein
VGARSAENQLHQKGSLQPQALRIPWSAVFARALADCSSSQRSNNSWRLSPEALATQTNRKARKPEREATCQVCGREDESGYHAVVRCPQAAALHDAMREHWMLPEENMFSYSGPECLLHLLGTVRPEERNNTLRVLWRA